MTKTDKPRLGGNELWVPVPKCEKMSFLGGEEIRDSRGVVVACLPRRERYRL